MAADSRVAGYSWYKMKKPRKVQITNQTYMKRKHYVSGTKLVTRLKREKGEGLYRKSEACRAECCFVVIIFRVGVTKQHEVEEQNENVGHKRENWVDRHDISSGDRRLSEGRRMPLRPSFSFASVRDCKVTLWCCEGTFSDGPLMGTKRQSRPLRNAQR